MNALLSHDKIGARNSFRGVPDLPCGMDSAVQLNKQILMFEPGEQIVLALFGFEMGEEEGAASTLLA